MIVYCSGFGTIWWLRPGHNPASSERFTSEAAVFNTTGFASGARERRNWTQAGLVRFNVGTCLSQRLSPSALLPGNYSTSGLEQRGTQTRLLLGRRVRQTTYPDLVLVCVRSSEFGRLSFLGGWRSEGVRLVASSEFQGRQETLLLLPTTAASITTDRGKWSCEWTGETWELVSL